MALDALDIGAGHASDALKAEARSLAARAEGMTAEEILRLARDHFGGGLALVSSFGADSAVLLHMVSEIDKATPVIFIDTGKLFGETLRHRDALVARLGLTDVRSVKPQPARLQEVDPEGTLWYRDTDACCAVRKVEPLALSLTGFDCWITGRKRHQAETRANLAIFEADGDKLKVNPLAGWTSKDVEAYRVAHDLPAHPLVADGYKSIGCMPCTDRVAEGEDERAGRWRGKAKTECGIHLGLAGREAFGSGI
ncbi:phosphoadenylyl-sulfate reductase [Chthonobacter rhizosphaerae]|uniref:phosphoadenylyl-sulfate reductase n=1 Tax=Chthonobacter rhizosphaerae TaxID=2735553 RepID=UPI0015EF916E|nr:phosphoadenylyl-sulfate reductase [Chthonobacter rhizosphaerae]